VSHNRPVPLTVGQIDADRDDRSRRYAGTAGTPIEKEKGS
jgi:hypothetical protein